MGRVVSELAENLSLSHCEEQSDEAILDLNRLPLPRLASLARDRNDKKSVCCNNLFKGPTS